MTAPRPAFDPPAFASPELSFLDPKDFWNTRAAPGTWRILACFRHGGGFGPAHEHVASIEWSNPRGQEMACRMLGLPGSALPELFNAEACFRALSFQACADAPFDIEFAEAATHPPIVAGGEATARMIAFSERGLLDFGSAFILLAASSGGSVRFSHPAIEASCRLGSVGDPIDFDPSRAVRERLLIDDAIDLEWLAQPSSYPLRIDIRACARELGIPIQATLAAPIFSHLPPHFLDRQAVLDALNSSGLDARSMACALPCPNYSALTREELFKFGQQEFQARQDAWLLRSHVPAREDPKPKARRGL